MSSQEKIEVPEKIWFVKNTRKNYNQNLVYLTHYEDNAACRSRMETGRSWCGDRKAEGEIHDNLLLSGYKILKNVSRWTTSNVVWRILDPRGFEFEIYSGNMMELISCATIINGVIQERCVIGRSEGKNVILPENSEPYVRAMEFTLKKLAAKTSGIKPSDLKNGDFVTLSDGKKYEFLGRFFPIFVKKIGRTEKGSTEVLGAPYSVERTLYIGDRKESYFIDSDGYLTKKSSPKIISIDSRKESEISDDMILDRIRKMKSSDRRLTWIFGSNPILVGLTNSKESNLEFDMTKIDELDESNLLCKIQGIEESINDLILIESLGERMYIGVRDDIRLKEGIHLKCYPISQLDKKTLTTNNMSKPHSESSFGSYWNRFRTVPNEVNTVTHNPSVLVIKCNDKVWLGEDALVR